MNQSMTFPDLSRVEPDSWIREKEARYQEDIRRAAALVLERGARFVFLAGPSCSGKTTTSLTLQKDLEEAGKRVFTFSTDDFFFDGALAPKNEDGSPNYDAFEHTDSAYIRSVLIRLAKEEKAFLPVFDFITGKRSTELRPLSPRDWDIIILEGIHALNDGILSALPQEVSRVCLYLDVTRSITTDRKESLLSPIDIRFCRRLIRDFKHRGADAVLTYSLWRNVVRMEEINLKPFLPRADLVLSSDLCYETAVVKEEVSSLLDRIPSDSPFFPEAKKLFAQLSFYPTLPESTVPPRSVLREFID